MRMSEKCHNNNNNSNNKHNNNSDNPLTSGRTDGGKNPLQDVEDKQTDKKVFFVQNFFLSVCPRFPPSSFPNILN